MSGMRGRKLVLLLYAMPNEGDLLSLELEGKEYFVNRAARFVKGTYNGRHVVLGMTGIGPENAVSGTSYALNTFDVSQVIVFGYCCGLSHPAFSVADLVISQSVATAQHEFINLNRAISERLCFLASRQIEGIPWGANFQPRVHLGQFLSVDKEVRDNSQVKQLVDAGADCADMELFWVAQICQERGVSVGALKVISDIPGIQPWHHRARIGKALGTATIVDFLSDHQ